MRVCGLKSYQQCPALDNPAGDMWIDPGKPEAHTQLPYWPHRGTCLVLSTEHQTPCHIATGRGISHLREQRAKVTCV